VLIGYINVRGIQMVGRVARFWKISFSAACGAVRGRGDKSGTTIRFSPLVRRMFRRSRFRRGAGARLWLYSGYEQVSSVAEEVEKSATQLSNRTSGGHPALHCHLLFGRRLFFAAALGDWQKWHTGYFFDAAQLIGGPGWLCDGHCRNGYQSFALNATVLTSTRMPSTMARMAISPVCFRRGIRATAHRGSRSSRPALFTRY